MVERQVRIVSTPDQHVCYTAVTQALGDIQKLVSGTILQCSCGRYKQITSDYRGEKCLEIYCYERD